MASVGEIYSLLDEKAPFARQMDFDNAGLLVGHSDSQVSRILVALDITGEVADEAAELGAELIVSHHPVIFHPVRSITDRDPTGQILLKLTEGRIAAICAHTDLDVAEGGVNDALAQRLGLSGTSLLRREGSGPDGRPYGIGRAGDVKETSLTEFALHVKRSLGANGVRVVDSGRRVHRVAVGGGACGDYLADAKALGCDTFVTSDVKYNAFLDAAALGINLIDAGHFPTENVVCPVLRDWISAAFPEISVTISRRHREIFTYL